MQNPTAIGYSTPARWLHWLVAAGIVLQYLLGERAEEAAETGALSLQLASLAQHKSVGMTVLVLAALRVIWRLLHQPPELPETYQQANPVLARLAKGAHIVLYGLLFFLPMSGWLMSSASAYSVSWFGVLTLPDLIGPSETAKEWLRSAHHLGAKVLFVLALIHIAAAFKHWLIDKSGVMGRMANTASVALFAATIAAGVWATWPGEIATAAVQKESQPAHNEAVQAEPAQAEANKLESLAEDTTEAKTDSRSSALHTPALWQIDHTQSHIRFTAVQAGARFSGAWQSFSAQIRFDATQLERSSALVQIDATSVATQDSERDSTLAGNDWFDSANFAEVTFAADAFSKNSDDTFLTEARIEIRGTSYPVRFNFTVESSGAQRTLKGRAQLDRLALNLGTKEWTDTEWVGQFVEVDVVVMAEI